MPATLAADRALRAPAPSSSPIPSAPRAADADDLRALEAALQTVLAPLDFPDVHAWQAAVHDRLLELTGADALCIWSPMADGAAAWYGPHIPRRDHVDYVARAARDPEWEVVEAGYARSGRPVVHEDELFPPEALEATPFYDEFLRPHRLHDLTIAGVDFGGRAPARLHFSNNRKRSAEATADCVAKVRTVLPALRAGLGLWHQLGARRAELGRVLDAMSGAVLLYDGDGEMLHTNPAAARLLGDGALADRLRGEAQRVAWAVGASTRRATAVAPEREVLAGTSAFRLRGALAPEWMIGRAHGVLVTLERAERAPLTDAELRTRYRLTPREIEVARLVAQGLSNEELAGRLEVSFFTARNHVERLLAKLGAPSRAKVGAMLRQEG